MTLPADPAEALLDGLALTDWNHQDLWIAGSAVGCNLTADGVDHILAGHQPPTAVEYNLLRLALNEHLHDLGLDHPVQSWRELLSSDA